MNTPTPILDAKDERILALEHALFDAQRMSVFMFGAVVVCVGIIFGLCMGMPTEPPS